MQRLQRERRVAHPGVAVVPVALAARRLGQRGRQRRHRRAGRHVGQALDGEGRALERVPQAVVGDPGARQPVAPELDGRVDVRRRPPRRRSAPARSSAHDSAQNALSPLVQHVAGAGGAALDADQHVGAEPERRAVGVGRVGAMPVVVDQASTWPRPGRSRTPARRRARPRPCPRGTRRCAPAGGAASSSAGGRVCGVTVSAPCRGPITSASCTRSQPPGVCQVVVRTLVPGT